MSGPGQYCPDPTPGSTTPVDLPPAKIGRRSRTFTHLPCPQCGKACLRKRPRTRVLPDVGDLVTGKPRDIALLYSQPRCPKGQKVFAADTSE